VLSTEAIHYQGVSPRDGGIFASFTSQTSYVVCRFIVIIIRHGKLCKKCSSGCSFSDFRSISASGVEDVSISAYFQQIIPSSIDSELDLCKSCESNEVTKTERSSTI
jgi:hypothetical protein